LYRKTFESRLARSHLAVWVAAAWHWSEGHNVRIPKTVDDQPDNGDLFIREKADEGWKRVEVKHIRRDWTGRSDWPFKKVIVCAKHSFDGAIQKPHQYLIFNHRMTHAIRVMGDAKDTWWSEEIVDSKRGGVGQQCYCTWATAVEFLSVPADLMVAP
jgi:hypothetical protein